MRPGLRRALCPLCLALVASAVGCGKRDEPTPTPAPSSSHRYPAVPLPPPPGSSAHANGHAAHKPGPPIPGDPSARLPTETHEPDWGLDPADPAKDYVTRYLKATQRYGDKSGCVTVAPSTFADGKSTVEVHNDPSGSCGAAGALRDRFFVTVATDRMSLDPSLKQPPLAAWPDGSDPDGPAAKVADLQDMRKWHAGLHDAFHALQLAPLRLQLYGRGTYAIVSLAGWHGPVTRDMTPEQLAGPAKTLCDANGGSPLAIFAGLDRSTLLRITCPGSARFESL